jgi:hypothetical protein
VTHTAPVDNSLPIPAFYRERAGRFGQAEQRLGRLVFQLSIALRSVSVGAVLCVAGLMAEPRGYPLWALFAGLLGASTALLALRDRKTYELRRYEQLRTINEQALARAERRWDAIPAPHAKPPEGFADTSTDLEIFGRASLFQLVSTAETSAGVRELKRWLSEPAPPSLVGRRQTAVAALAPELERRQELQVCGRLISRGLSPPAEFLQWAESDRPSFGPLAIWLARLSACVVVLLILGLFSRLVSAEAGGIALCAMGSLHLFVTAASGGRVYHAFRAVSSGAAEARLNHSFYRLAAGFPAEGEILANITAQATEAMQSMGRLERIVVLADVRRWFLLYIPLQFLFLWDFHVVAMLERWKSHSGRSYRGWFEAVAELEALASFAALKHDHPDWIFPVVRAEGPPSIEAAGIGHPLLRDEVRVANDVTVGPPGEILMVTGSNMSGKSTLLRSLGINIVLAQAGAPVCATRMSLPPIELATVMRVTDSLERGVSLFMAELGRLRQVVERAAHTELHPDRLLCYLLDEILHGTNSAERHLAAVRILGRLASAGAIGAVSTHDLALCDAASLADRSRNVHFQETIVQEAGRVQMTFDYRLRPGVASTTNVRFLLDAVGLSDPCS